MYIVKHPSTYNIVVVIHLKVWSVQLKLHVKNISKVSISYSAVYLWGKDMNKKEGIKSGLLKY